MPCRLAGLCSGASGAVADRLDHPVVDARGMGEQLAAMHHPVADAVELAARGVLHHRQQLGEGGAVVGVGNHQAVAVAAALPAQHRIAAAQALGEAVQGNREWASLTRANLIDELPQLITSMLREGITAPWSALLLPGHTSRSEIRGRAVCAARFVKDPGARLPGRLVAQVLSMATGQDCHPMAFPRPDENQSPATALARPVHQGARSLSGLLMRTLTHSSSLSKRFPNHADRGQQGGFHRLYP